MSLIKSIQRGVYESAGSIANITINAVNTNKAMLITSGTGADVIDGEFYVRGAITSPTNICITYEFYRSSGGWQTDSHPAISIAWQVIEFN
jgi:hypothetical protein